MLCSYPGSAHPSSEPCGPDGEMGEAFFSPLADDSSFNGKVKANRKKKKKREETGILDSNTGQKIQDQLLNLLQPLFPYLLNWNNTVNLARSL